MTADPSANDLSDLLSEAEEDYVGLWLVVRHVREHSRNANQGDLRKAVTAIVRIALDEGLAFGQFDADRRFIAWQPNTVLERLLAEWAALGHDPDIGDIGWIVRM